MTTDQDPIVSVLQSLLDSPSVGGTPKERQALKYAIELVRERVLRHQAHLNLRVAMLERAKTQGLFLSTILEEGHLPVSCSIVAESKIEENEFRRVELVMGERETDTQIVLRSRTKTSPWTTVAITTADSSHMIAASGYLKGHGV